MDNDSPVKMTVNSANHMAWCVNCADLRARLAECERELKELRDWGGQGGLWGDLEDFFRLDAEDCDCAADVKDGVILAVRRERADAQHMADRYAETMTENRVLLEVARRHSRTWPDVELEIQQLAPFIAAEVERVRALEEDNHKLRMGIVEHKYADMTPDDDLPSRLLSAYLDYSEWSDNTLGMEPTNPVIIEMNRARHERNAIIEHALAALKDTP